MSHPTLDDDIPPGHAFQEYRVFHPNDQRLRAHRFRIKFRPSSGPAIWERFEEGKWREYTEAQAVAVYGREIARKVKEVGA
jgi:hypothetical protein